MTHDYSATPHEINVPYFEGSGLNTAWNGVRSGSSSWDNVDVTYTPTPPKPGDADGNGTVDANDAAMLAANWLGGKLRSPCKHTLYPSITFPTTPQGKEP